ncbi:hypothetical protein EPA93_01865 [Ktedonosporobacter rubrisoli]|uniref:Uncharacterized protein n=1 Tax=Ktedonosporobacter rubrisoli TaxID=2509675 RepID=A0A4P6JJG3_KTERU|nr:hypothetical protein [Ktedonosporobacter rubrisoli]QBD74806.1 hypothetical protein EPA93_01865 [Ktedonosporobacter rubrisoli]
MRHYEEPMCWLVVSYTEAIALHGLIHQFLDYHRSPGQLTAQNRELVALLEHLFLRLGESPYVPVGCAQREQGGKA